MAVHAKSKPLSVFMVLQLLPLEGVQQLKFTGFTFLRPLVHILWPLTPFCFYDPCFGPLFHDLVVERNFLDT